MGLRDTDKELVSLRSLKSKMLSLALLANTRVANTRLKLHNTVRTTNLVALDPD